MFRSGAQKKNKKRKEWCACSLAIRRDGKRKKNRLCEYGSFLELKKATLLIRISKAESMDSDNMSVIFFSLILMKQRKYKIP